MKIILIGPYPPPMGGISVHMKRINQYLKKEGLDVTIYNESKEYTNSIKNVINIDNYKRFVFKVPFLKGDIIHFHCIDKRVRLLLGVYAILRKNIILTIHGESLSEQLNESNYIIRNLLLFSIKRINRIICVNSKTVDEFIRLGVRKDRVVCIPAYCNPIRNDSDYKLIPNSIWNFINKSKFLISANGAIRFNNGVDLYGVDMLIELIKKIKESGKNARLLFCVLSVEDQTKEEKEYYLKLKKQVKLYKLENYILLYEVKNTELYPILQNSNLFIRPTSVDGYGVSVAEAIYYNVPSIASDVCKRTKGTILFENRNFDDLYIKVNYVIDNFEKEKEKLKNVRVEDNSEKILEVYKSLLSDGKNNEGY